MSLSLTPENVPFGDVVKEEWSSSQQRQIIKELRELVYHKEMLIETQNKTIENLRYQLSQSELKKQLLEEMVRESHGLSSEGHSSERLEIHADMGSELPSSTIMSFPFSTHKDANQRLTPSPCPRPPLPPLCGGSSATSVTAAGGSLSHLSNEREKSAGWTRYTVASEGLSELSTLKRLTQATLKAVEQCIEDGADVCYQSDDMSRSPAFHRFIEQREVKFIKACLQTRHPIDFTITDPEGFTPLLLLARKSCSSPSKSVEILRLVVRRLETHPLLDNVNWGQKSPNGYDFCNIAADYECLSAFWPIVKTQPFFAYRREPIELRVRIHAGDWTDLGFDNKPFFDPVKGFR